MVSSDAYVSDTLTRTVQFQCLNRQMVSSDRGGHICHCAEMVKFQCLNRQMVSSDALLQLPSADIWHCFNASIGRWCLQTRQLRPQIATGQGFNASIGRWCLQT